jgi:hypothetical protein
MEKEKTTEREIEKRGIGSNSLCSRPSVVIDDDMEDREGGGVKPEPACHNNSVAEHSSRG